MRQFDKGKKYKTEKIVGEEKSLEYYIDLYKDNVRAIANKYYISDGSGDDLFQEGLIGLSQGYKTYDTSHGEVGSEAFKSFVLMCAKRQIIDAVKRSNSKRNLPMNNFVSISSDDFVETAVLGGVSGETLEDEVINRVSGENDLILNLSEFERRVLDLYLEGLKQSEIASELNRATKSIDNTLQRIKTKLKRKN